MIKRMPIVVVLGATGAGKSKLALEVAQKFGGEIISADAMQMYKGLDIVTNKVTTEEQQLVKHHMIDFLDPMLKSSVVDFRNQVNLIRASFFQSDYWYASQFVINWSQSVIANCESLHKVSTFDQWGSFY